MNLGTEELREGLASFWYDSAEGRDSIAGGMKIFHISIADCQYLTKESGEMEKRTSVNGDNLRS